MKKIILSLIAIIASATTMSAITLSEAFDRCAEVESTMKMDIPVELMGNAEGIHSGKMAMFDISKADAIHAITAEIPKDYIMASVNHEGLNVNIYCQPHENNDLVNLFISIEGEEAGKPQLVVLFLTCEKSKINDVIKIANQ